MSINKVNELFSSQELEILQRLIESDTPTDDETLGRVRLTFNIPNDIYHRLSKMVSEMYDRNLVISRVLFVEYSNQHGQPNLPPHMDGDNTDVVIDYQLSANTRWDLGVDMKTYELEDNSALFFNPNTTVHWRPHKVFKDGEYVKMIFFRLCDPENPSDYSHMNYDPGHEIFKEIREYRDSLNK